MEDQVLLTWSSISTRKKTLRSRTQTTTISTILADSPIMGLPAFCMTIARAWIMRLTPSSITQDGAMGVPLSLQPGLSTYNSPEGERLEVRPLAQQRALSIQECCVVY